MTTQQEQIQFTIQTLEGETFQVSIPLSEAEKTYVEGALDLTLLFNHEKYGLDALNDAIRNHNGTENDIQQLVCDEELTIQTYLPSLVDKVITLIVKSPFQIEFISTPGSCVHPLLACRGKGLFSDLHTDTFIAYLHLWYEMTTHGHQLRVVGQMRDYFKIAFADINDSGGVVRKTRWVNSQAPSYQITEDTPSHVWLHFNKAYMKIIE
jgi:hypothetical protein